MNLDSVLLDLVVGVAVLRDLIPGVHFPRLLLGLLVGERVRSSG